MKLKLFTQKTQSLTDSLLLIHQLRKFVILRFTPSLLYIISVHEGLISKEPQIWCKLKMTSIFQQMLVESINNNIILIEINIELLIQSLRHFERSNNDGLNIRLQRKDLTGSSKSNESGRNASLALFYSNISPTGSAVNHTFKIPVKILKNNHASNYLKEPELSSVDLFMTLPNAFVNTYKRLDKFRRNVNDLVTIKASRRGGGFLGFVLEEEGKYKVTISWNEKLDIRKPLDSIQTDSILQTGFVHEPDENIDDDDVSEDKQITLKLKDWKMAAKIVASCKTVIFLMTHDEACVLHCLLDETDDVEVVYYINAVKVRDLD